MRKVLTISLFIALISPLAALAEESPFRGRVGVEFAWVSTNDRFDPYADVSDPSTPGADPAMDSRLQVIPILDVGARWEAINSSVYLATPFRAPGLPLALGIYHEVSDGTGIDLSIYSILDRQEWRDPYAASDTKKVSSVLNGGVRLDMSDIASSGFGITGLWQSERVVDDELGDQYAALNRTGKVIEVAARYPFEIGGGFSLTPVAAYERGDFNGDANSFRGSRFSLVCSTEAENFAMNANIGYGSRNYSKENPVFNETLKETSTQFSTLLTWKRPAGIKSLYIDLHAALDLRDANISYHDAETWLLGAGASLGF